MTITIPKHPEHSNERGSVLVYVAILIFVVLGIAGMSIDGAFLASTSQQLQSAADGAALNAARILATETDPAFSVTRNAAIAVAAANEAAKVTVKLDANVGNGEGGDIVIGYWDAIAHTFTPTLTDPNAVRVHANRSSSNADGPLALLLGPIVGKQTSDVGAVSTAVVAPSADPLVLILDPTGNGALSVNGNNSLDVSVGKLHANSTHDCGISLVGNPTVIAMLTRVVGGACYPDGSLLGQVQENASVYPDPLADVLPTVGAWNIFKSGMALPDGPNGKISSSGTYDPGYYPKGLNATANTSIVLNPGAYLFGDHFKLAGNAFVTGDGVTLFLDKNVDLDITGSGAGMDLRPPGEGSPFYGITLFTHRQSAGKSVAKIGGGGVLDVEGVVYVPAGELVMSGTPGKEIGGIIAFTVSTQGTTGYIITGEGVPPFSDGTSTAYLVE